MKTNTTIKSRNNKSLMIGIAAGLSLSLLAMSSAQAAKGGNGGGKGGKPVVTDPVITDPTDPVSSTGISYSIDASCNVTFTSADKDITRVTINYLTPSDPIDYSNRAKSQTVPGNNFKDAITVFVKTGKGKKDNGEVMDSALINEVEDCLTPPVDWGTCPYTQQLQNFIQTNEYAYTTEADNHYVTDDQNSRSETWTYTMTFGQSAIGSIVELAHHTIYIKETTRSNYAIDLSTPDTTGSVIGDVTGYNACRTALRTHYGLQ